MRFDKRKLKDIVVTICCSCDYYDEEQINELIGVMDSIENLSEWQKSKIKADNYSRFGLYEKAVESMRQSWKKMICSVPIDEDYGKIYHNMGTAFCGLGAFMKSI